MNRTKDIQFRKFENADINGIVELLNSVFKPKFTKDWWTWKYELNPNGFYGAEGDIWVAESEGKIVGHYALIPEKIKLNSEAVLAAQSVDTATHPDYRGLGIFQKLAEKVYAQAAQRYAFVFGFPSGMAYKGFLNLGWKQLSPVPEHNKILNYDAFVKRKFGQSSKSQFAKLLLKSYAGFNSSFSKGKYSRGHRNVVVETRQENTFPDEIDTFWNQIRSKYPVALERTATFLNWKFSKNFGEYKIFIGRSANDKKIIGYIVTKKTSYTLDIVDLLSMPDQNSVAADLINVAIDTARAENRDSIRCWLPKWHNNASILSMKGFISPRQVNVKKTYNPQFMYFGLGMNNFEPKVNEWYYTFADTDYV